MLRATVLLRERGWEARARRLAQALSPVAVSPAGGGRGCRGGAGGGAGATLPQAVGGVAAVHRSAAAVGFNSEPLYQTGRAELAWPSS
jgi:hypothetical protein